MTYNKFIIECDTDFTMAKAIELVNNDIERIVKISNTIFCLNGTTTATELIKVLIFNNLLNVHIIVIDETELNVTLATINEIYHPAIYKFIGDSNISDDLNYFLDLITERGGTQYLNQLERQRLFELGEEFILE